MSQENMLVALHGKCGKLKLETELPDTADECDPPPILEHDGKLYVYTDQIVKLEELGVDWENDLTFRYVQIDPVKV